jgi:hypothetical protein
MRLDTLTSIKVFRQVVESGSFVAAAERLNLSTAMVSKHVMHAEKRLGVRLLNRNSRTLSLTEPGCHARNGASGLAAWGPHRSPGAIGTVLRGQFARVSEAQGNPESTRRSRASRLRCRGQCRRLDFQRPDGEG